MINIDQILEEITETCYYVPTEELADISSGRPSAYIRGITNGRNQAIKIIEGKLNGN